MKNGLRKLWKSWRLKGCVAGIAHSEQTLAMVQGWLRDHEGCWNLYVSNALMGNAEWLVRKEEIQGMESRWLRNIQEWRTLEESMKREYVLIWTLSTLGVLFSILGVAC